MPIYENNLKLTARDKGGAMDSVYKGDEQVFSSFVPAGTVLWQSSSSTGTAFFKGIHNYGGKADGVNVVDYNSFTLDVDFSKVKNGLVFNFAQVVWDVDPSGGAGRDAPINSAGTGAVQSSQFTLDQLRGKVAIFKFTANYVTTHIYAQLSGNVLTFTNDYVFGGSTPPNATTLYFYNGNNYFSLLKIMSITAN